MASTLRSMYITNQGVGHEEDQADDDAGKHPLGPSWPCLFSAESSVDLSHHDVHRAMMETMSATGARAGPLP